MRFLRKQTKRALSMHEGACNHLSMDGTSMASPAVAGILAVLLSNAPAYQKLPRDRSRSDAAKDVLRSSCRDVGLRLTYQGLGAPRL